jgi:OmpA-OmpF porin, OOP family
VKNLLIQFGIPDNRIEVRAFGDSQPIGSNNTSEGRALNRRVVFKFHLKNS